MPTAIYRVNKAIHAMGSARVRQMQLAASQTIVRGDILVTNSSGQLALAASQGSNIGAVNAAGYGKAYIADASSTNAAAGTMIQVVAVGDDTVLRFPLTTNGSVQAWAVGQTGLDYELRNVAVGGVNCFCVDVNANTNKKVTVQQLDPDTPSTDVDGIVLVTPIAGQWGY